MLYKVDLIHPELSYIVVGCAFEVFNEIGRGHKESVYHNALGVSLKKSKLNFRDKVYFPVKFEVVTVGKNYFDYLIEDKIVIEIKTSDRFVKAHYDQISNYLHISNLKLGILISFGRAEVKFKRVLNIDLLNKEKENKQNQIRKYS